MKLNTRPLADLLGLEILGLDLHMDTGPVLIVVLATTACWTAGQRPCLT